MPETRLHTAPSAPDFEDCLTALSAHQTLLCLDGGPGGWSYLMWDAPGRPLRHLDDLPTISHGQAHDAGLGWPGHIDGGWLVQLDYEFPVGPWALPLLEPGTITGWAWPLDRALAWDPQGQCHLIARDEDDVTALTQTLASLRPRQLPPPGIHSPITSAWDASGHQQRVEAIVAAITCGEIYQANLTLPFTTRLKAGPARDIAVFLALRRQAPGCCAALLRHRGRSIISHSPETFLQVHNHRATSMPIKGTRRRTANCDCDQRAALLAAAKDNAELAMIVDLVRNDLGRVAQRGGVRVVVPARVIDLSYVHHLVADISAPLAPLVDHRALLAATFPPGSITGAPKIQAMRVIQGLEAGPRGPYCGSFGWLGRQADCALSVAIRTMVMEADDRSADHDPCGGAVSVRFDAGGGIVADSNGADEWAEVLAKSAPMASALGITPW